MHCKTVVLCRINPTGELYFDGMTLGPYDVLFVKLKRLMLEGRTPGTTTALRYQNWRSAVVSIAGNLCRDSSATCICCE